MKIVLVEEKAAPNSGEKTFETDSVKIGRDAEECQIYFERAKYPMVSRRHAELRCSESGWILNDTGSSYGTFLNGKKISAPEKVQAGNTIQFGIDGPVLIVLWLETGGLPKSKAVISQKSPNDFASQIEMIPESGVSEINRTNSERSIPPPNLSKPFNSPLPAAPSNQVPGNTPSLPKTPAQSLVAENHPIEPHSASPNNFSQAARFDFPDGKFPPFQLTKDQIRLGRDKQCDVVFDADAVMVSRRHAEVSRQNSDFILSDNNSFNGTLVNGQRISVPVPLYHGDEIQLGQSGPVLRFNFPPKAAPKDSSLAGQRMISDDKKIASGAAEENAFGKTIVFKGDSTANLSRTNDAEPRLLMRLTFGAGKELIIGRNESCNIKLDGLQISNRHARLTQSNPGVIVEDLNSTNGVYVNGKRISRQVVAPTDTVQIGSFVIQVDAQANIAVFDTRSKTRIDCVKIIKEVKNKSGGTIRLLDDISLSIQPNEFVGLLGPSGSGKSTLMDALNGMRPASSGNVLINNTDLYQNPDALKQSIGYVPQDDIIHRELSVYDTLYYVAKLRLSNDVSKSEINRIIDEVLDITGLSERQNISVSELSGGQRKRVSIAVELITKPSIIFLDEPTSGLDPAAEEKIMNLFRQIAESGRTVILTTHAPENVKLFDKIVLLMRGKLAFYGTPEEVLAYTGAKSFKELYDKLEEGVERGVEVEGESRRPEITERVAENWKQQFLKTPQFKKNVYEPLKEIAATGSQGVGKKRGLGIFGAVKQWLTLSHRYRKVLFRDKFTLFILFAQAPIIAILTALVTDAGQPRDFIYFILSIVSVWFGTSVAAREIIRERPVYIRERMVNLGLLSYLGSKLFVLGIIVSIQCLLLFLPLKLLDSAGIISMPGTFLGIPQFWIMLLTAGIGIAIGLLISALVKTSEMATGLVPLILIPQILFSGLVGVPTDVSKVVGLTMPVTWSFDAMKRFSLLDTLEQEGSEENTVSKDSGYYKFIEQKNDKLIEDAQKDLKDYKTVSEKKVNDYINQVKAGQNPPPLKLDEPPEIGNASKTDRAEIGKHITFLHPWMNQISSQIVLMLMFLATVTVALVVLRLQDIG